MADSARRTERARRPTHEPGRFHGYPVGWKEVPETIRSTWISEGLVRRAVIRKYWDDIGDPRMSTRWERLAGDTARFAIKIAFIDDPDGGRAQDPDLAASWGALTLWAGSANLTAHAGAGDTLESVRWYLLPFLEWLAENWDPLLHEERLPGAVRADDAAESLAATAFPPPALWASDAARHWETDWQLWWKRHALQACREGGPFPDIALRRWRDQIEVSWRNRPPAGLPRDLSFLAANGNARFDVAEVACPLHDMLRDAVAYLRHRYPSSERIARLSERAKALRSEAAGTQRLAWLAGLGNAARSSLERWNEVVRAATKVSHSLAEYFRAPQTDELFVSGSCHGALLFGSASPTITADDVIVLAKAMTRATRAGKRDLLIDAHAKAQPVRQGSAAWEQGYELADQFRAKLGLRDDEVPDDLRGIVAKLGVTIDKVVLSDHATRAVSLAGAGLAPTILINDAQKARETRERFTLAHELCHLLVDRDMGARLAIASGPWAPLDVERRANAFAACLLMPEGAVSRAVAGLNEPIDTLASIISVASKLRASLTATIERLHDLHYLDDVQQETLKDELAMSRVAPPTS